MTTSALPAAISSIPVWTAVMAEAHWRITVWAEVVTGKPARSAA